MASLNTLRTKFGVVLSIIIALALLAFIFSLRTEMGFSGNDPQVGEINGETINYSEYYEQYEARRKQRPQSENSDQQADALANEVWQALINKYVMTPGFEDMGIKVSEAEVVDLVSGRYPSQVMLNYFGNPETGKVDPAILGDFLAQVNTNPQAMQMWQAINAQAKEEREFTKFSGLIRGGVYVNSLEVESGVEHANKLATGKFIVKKYDSVADSLVSVSEAEMKEYYNAHQNLFKQRPNRTLSYVVFEVNATDDDMAKLENDVMKIGEEFKTTTDLRNYTRGNHYGRIANNYVAPAQLNDEEGAALKAGETYGPVLKNNEWKMARALNAKMVPDSIGARDIVLRSTDSKLADSLMQVAKSGADFAELAIKHSLNGNAKQGGEMGVMPFSDLPIDIAEKMVDAKKGDIIKVEYGQTIILFEIYRADKKSEHYQIASITYPVVASDATRIFVQNEADTFLANAKGSLEGFNEAAATAAITPRMTTLSNGDRDIRGLEDSRELVRWAFGAEKGEISKCLRVGKDHVVAIITEVDDAKVAPFAKVKEMIKHRLMTDKKFEMISKELKGASLEEQAASWKAEIVPFENIAYSAYYLPNAGIEPVLCGAIATAEEGKVSAPVKGGAGVYVFVVDTMSKEAKQTAEGERVRAKSIMERSFLQMSMPAIYDMSNIEDLRGQYF